MLSKCTKPCGWQQCHWWQKAHVVFTAHQLLNICKYVWSQCDFGLALDPQKFLSAFTAHDENNNQISFEDVGFSPAMDHTADVDAAILPSMQRRKDAWRAWKELMLRHAAVTPRVTYRQDIVELWEEIAGGTAPVTTPGHKFCYPEHCMSMFILTCRGVGHAWQNDPFSFLSQ